MAFVGIGLDLHILICTYLHPSDILALRETCKSLQIATRQRTIWIDALHRVCIENTLFLPSFPILDMSDSELEHAAIAPRRWIELSTPEARPSPTMTRIIDDPFASKRITKIILVPGGRYMVCFSLDGLGVWDLGYTPSADCKLIGSEGCCSCASGDVHATPDGMGLVIFSHCRENINRCSFYEIYPQSENPKLTKLACLDLPFGHNLRSCVSPDKLIWFMPHQLEQDIIFNVWDYRLNASVSFLAPVDVRYIGRNTKVVATQTAIVVLHHEEIFIWAIPPLLHRSPNFFDNHSLDRFPPVTRIKLPHRPSLHDYAWSWRTTSSWYFDPSKPLYLDQVYSRCWQLQRFKLIIETDLSDATLHFINTIQLASKYNSGEVSFQSKLCEDTLVYSYGPGFDSDRCGIATGSTLPLPTLHGNPSMTKISPVVDKSDGISICPASGRLIHLHSGRDTEKIVVYDFLPHQGL